MISHALASWVPHTASMTSHNDADRVRTQIGPGLPGPGPSAVPVCGYVQMMVTPVISVWSLPPFASASRSAAVFPWGVDSISSTLPLHGPITGRSGFSAAEAAAGTARIPAHTAPTTAPSVHARMAVPPHPSAGKSWSAAPAVSSLCPTISRSFDRWKDVDPNEAGPIRDGEALAGAQQPVALASVVHGGPTAAPVLGFDRGTMDPEVNMAAPDRIGGLTLAGLRARRSEITALASLHGASEIAIFGSVARGDSASSSDVDFVVRMAAGRSLLDLGGLVMDLRDLLGVAVDVVTLAGVGPRVRERIAAESVPL